MILLGVLSQYSWLDFMTFIVFVDGIVLAFGFALDKFVWSKTKGLTKNDQRTIRESDDDDDRDYRKLNDSVTDYNDVKSIDDSMDDDYGEAVYGIKDEEEYIPHTSKIAESIAEDEVESKEEGYVPNEMADDDLEDNNEQAQEFFYERDDCYVATDDNFDGFVNENYQTIDDEDGEAVYATAGADEELTELSIKQGEEDEFKDYDLGNGVIDEYPEGLELALPIPLSEADEIDDPKGEEEPEYPEE